MTRTRAVDVALFILVMVAYVLSPIRVMTDSMRMTYVASEMVHSGTIALDRYRDDWDGNMYALEEYEGRLLSYPPWFVAAFAAPLLAVEDAVRAVRDQPRLADAAGPWPFETIGNQVWSASLVVALSCVVIRRIALERLGDHVRNREAIATAVALTYAFGTAAWSTASRSLWMHGPVMLLFAVAVLMAIRAERNRRYADFLGIPLALAFATRPTAAVASAGIALWIVLRHRRSLPFVLLGAVAVLGPWMAVNQHFYGSVLPSYYSSGRIDLLGEWVPNALAGTLISPSRGLFAFSPILLLAVIAAGMQLVRRRLDALDICLWIAVIGHWLSVSGFSGWWGGHSYGPRLMADVVPLLTVLALPAVTTLVAMRRGAVKWALSGVVVLVAAGSVVLNSSGALFMSSVCWNEQRGTSARAAVESVWDWSDPQQLRALRNIVTGEGLAAELDRTRRCV